MDRFILVYYMCDRMIESAFDFKTILRQDELDAWVHNKSELVH